MSVRRAQAEIDSHEFGEWVAYDEIELGEPERSDIRIASVCCMLANIWRSRKEPYKLSDFILPFSTSSAEGTPVRKVDQKALRTKLLSWKAGLNARFDREKARGNQPTQQIRNKNRRVKK